MRATLCIVTLCSAAACMAQGFGGGIGFGRGGGLTNGGVGTGASASGSAVIMAGMLLGPRNLGAGNLQMEVHAGAAARPSGPLPSFPFTFHADSRSGVSYFSATFTDSVKHELFGFEVLLDPQQNGGYLATFAKEPSSTLQVVNSDWRNWTIRDLPLPAPQAVHDGDVISFELASNPSSGQKLFWDAKIGPFTPGGPGSGVRGAPALSPRAPSVPTVDGTAREFTVADVDMRLIQPRITLNNKLQPALSTPTASGSLIWLYLPDHGRYVLSLAPRPELDFKPSGEVRGGSVQFTLDGDAIRVESPIEIAPGHASYIIYVLHDPQWEPTSSKQKGQPAIGSVAPGELAKLRVP